MKIRFLINRLQRMSVGEIVHRLVEKKKALSDRAPGVIESHFSYDRSIPLLNRVYTAAISEGQSDKAADDLLTGRMTFFALRPCEFGVSLNFHKDYATGLSALSVLPCRAIDYRDSAKIGDIKYIWEPNRMLFLPQLAQAFKETEDNRYLESASAHLEAWLEQNPFMMGVNWGSCLELGIRLINWSVAWPIISPKISDYLKERWTRSIYQHCWAIDRYPSKYSSANNHLIGELSGLFIATLALPSFAESDQWRQHAFEGLVKECEAQQYSDGINKEQAISYQQFVLDFLILPGAYALAYERETGDTRYRFPDSYWSKIEKMIQAIASLTDFGQEVPQIGDEDDGFVINIGNVDFGIYKSLLNTGSELFQQPDWAMPGIDTKTEFIISLTGGSIFTSPSELPPSADQYPDGGYYILANDNGPSGKERALIDCGPLGFLSLAAHGHADALSFFFSVGGRPVFIDPGTYAYHAKKEWRDYFRGTCAHNTVTIDNQDQSKIAGNFMWSRKAQARLVSWKPGEVFEGEHDGYRRLGDPVVHRRRISVKKGDNTWEITDFLDCNGKHEVAVHFHCHPSFRATLKDNQIFVQSDSFSVHLYPPKGCKTEILRGQTNPISGWYSPSYDVKEPIDTIRISTWINGTTELQTAFKVG